MKDTVLEVLERSQNLAAALKALGYSIDAMSNIDNGEKELREIGWNIANQIECLQEYQSKTLELIEQLKSAQRERAEPAEIQEKMLTKAEAEELFEKNAVLLDYTSNAVPFYRMIEIFGEDTAAFIESHMKHEGYISLGKDYGCYGMSDPDHDVDRYMYKSGFLKVVANYNKRLAAIYHDKSEGGHIWNRYWEKRCRNLDEEDAAAERKEKEKQRKSKRAAAKEKEEN